jgi:hypothetical protein
MNAIEKISQDLAVTSSVPDGLSITTDVRLRQVQAEMLSRYHMALMLPRNWTSVNAKLLAACENPDFAKTAFYSKPAGDKKIEGLSVRFAELAQQLMRNISIDTSPEMEDSLSVHYRMTVTDMESNTPTSETFKVEKTVERRYKDEDTTVLSQRKNTYGDTVYLVPATEDQITTKLRAQMAKVKRQLILSLVPAEIRAQCLARCKEIALSSDSKDPQAATKSIVSAFLSIGVDVPDLKEYLGHSPASLVTKEIEDLRGIYALIRDGEMTWTDVIEAKREQAASTKSGSKAAFVEQKKKAREKRNEQKPPRQARAAAPAATDAAKKPDPPSAVTPPKEEPPKRQRANRRAADDDNATPPPAGETQATGASTAATGDPAANTDTE